jgi:hypothetical protein
LYQVVQDGRFKTPNINVGGSKSENIFREEMLEFYHDETLRWFGSLEKGETGGIQDDGVYSTAWGMWGARMKGVDDFRSRKPGQSFGFYMENRELVASYK